MKMSVMLPWGSMPPMTVPSAAWLWYSGNSHRPGQRSELSQVPVEMVQSYGGKGAMEIPVSLWLGSTKT